MSDILNITFQPTFDERIVKIDLHTYNPYANSILENNSEIRIPIQHQDLYVLPCESFLYIEGKLTWNKSLAPPAPQPQQAEATAATSKASTIRGDSVRLSNNCAAFLFEEIRYEINGVEVDRARNLGITSSLKNYISLSSDNAKAMQCASWDITSSNLKDSFNFCVPLSTLFGFCDDYKSIIINARHELIIIRSRNDDNCIIGREGLDAKIDLFKIQWKMPRVLLNESSKLSLLRTLERGRFLSLSFRSWDLYEFPLLPRTTKHTWAVKTATQLEKPRYMIFALQTGRKNNVKENVTMFNHCNLSNLKIFLNSEFYPYDDMNLNFDKDKNIYAILYHMYCNFCKTYYGKTNVYLTIDEFLTYGPFVVIDCSRQNESVKSGTVDVRIEFECRENIPANTTAYCLIIHDRIVEYNPLTNVIRKVL